MTLKDHLRQSPFTLALSSGFFGFFAHCGVVLALSEEDLKPARITGSSAGAIVAAAWAHGVDAGEFRSILSDLRKSHFWDPGFGAGLLKGSKLEDLLREILNGRSQEMPLSISLFEIFTRRTRAFSEGDIPKLVRASVAVPLMFHPVRIGRHFYWDGGILDKMAIVGTTPQENVLVHYLPGEGMHSIYERRRDLTKLGGNRRALVIDKLPQVGPNALDRGTRALEVAYEATKKALARELTEAPVLQIGS